MDPLEPILQMFSPYDLNHDEIFEINSLTTLDDPLHQKIEDNDNLLLIVINSKLLKPDIRNPWVNNLLKSLEVYRSNLIDDGYKPRFIEADIYYGEKHQDGHIVLAIREFFKEVKNNYPYFKGAVLIGSFPEAYLVRTYPWKKWAGSGKKGIKINKMKFENIHYLKIWPEPIATRSDIVLCDLDGKWEQIYIEEKTKLPSLLAVPSKSLGAKNWPEYGSTSIIDIQKEEGLIKKIIKFFVGSYQKHAYEVNSCETEFQDFFHINDGKFNIYKNIFEDIFEKITETRVEILDQRNFELNSQDLQNQNPIATPEIIVSRINAKNIAFIPNPKYKGDAGRTLLDNAGIPQEIKAKKVDWKSLFIRDPLLECRLIVECLERNHKHRTNSTKRQIPHVGAISGPDFTTSQLTSPMSGGFYLSSNYDVEDACLSEYVNWLLSPLVLRGIIVHSTSQTMIFRSILTKEMKFFLSLLFPKLLAEKMIEEQYEIQQLKSVLGKKPQRWYWDKINKKLCPGWKKHESHANIHVHKALWNTNRSRFIQGSFYVINACNANSPPYAEIYPYNHVDYGKEQVAESLFFYVSGLALIARAKAFNDLPKNIMQILVVQGKPFGEIWSEYFNIDKQDASLDSVKNGIKRKRAYFWGVIGDWTLKYEY
ncbi:MAG: hypothetical protein ACFFDT_23230 [Candidatus Hodarchaeota archaeon]